MMVWLTGWRLVAVVVVAFVLLAYFTSQTLQAD